MWRSNEGHLGGGCDRSLGIETIDYGGKLFQRTIPVASVQLLPVKQSS